MDNDLSLRRSQVPSETISPLGSFDYEPVNVTIQEHNAIRRGKHYDLRIVTPDRAISFVIPWGNLMRPTGDKGTFIRMPDHVPEYATFEGQIPEGEYGAGNVRVVQRYPGTLNTDSSGNTFLTVGDRGGRRRIMLTPPKDNRYFAITRSLPTDRHWQERPQYKVLPSGINENRFSASEKLDGALVYAKILPSGITLTSRRKSVTGDTIHKEHHVPWIRDLRLPKKYHGMVIAGELVHPKGFQFTSAIMNSKSNTAIAKQKTMGRMYFSPHNVLSQSLPHKDKIELMRSFAESANSKYIKLPRYSDKPSELFRRIKAEGGEGIVLFNPNEVDAQMYKKKLLDSFNGKVIDIVEGQGKYKGSLGAMVVADMYGNTVRVGGGKGLNNSLRKKIYEHPEDYMGKHIRVLATGSTGSSLRQPRFDSFIGNEEPLDAFDQSEALYQKYLEKFKTASYASGSLGQAELDSHSIPHMFPGTKKEPVHIRFNDRTHYGVGDYGEHIGTVLNGANVHIYKDKLFVIRPDGKAFSIPLRRDDLQRARHLLELLRPVTERVKAAIWA